jgi:hypothetical protein
MLKKNQLFHFDEKQVFYYVILIFNNLNQDKLVDLSIFTEDEWNYLFKIGNEFHTRQIGLEREDDNIFSWRFHYNNPKKEENESYHHNIYWMDKQLQKVFDTKFCDMNVEIATRDELTDIYYHLQNQNNLTTKVTKDTLRKWFVENICTIETYYHSVQSN